MGRHLSLWGCIRAFVLGSPMTLLNIYLVFYLFLQVPLRNLLAPSVASCAVTVMIGPLAFFAWRRRSLYHDARLAKALFGAYLIGLTSVDIYYAVVLGAMPAHKGRVLLAMLVPFYVIVTMLTIISEKNIASRPPSAQDDAHS